VAVTPKLDSGLASDCASPGKGTQYALDPAGDTARQWNATWSPRSYLVDEAGKVRYVQSVTTMTGMAPLEVRRLLGSGAVAFTGDPRGTRRGP
jgi:hypothetical protein